MKDFTSLSEGDRVRHVGQGDSWTVERIVFDDEQYPEALVLVRVVVARNAPEWEHTGYRLTYSEPDR